MPWKTVQTELQNYRVTHESASMAHWIFKCATLLPACVLPPKIYYSLEAPVCDEWTVSEDAREVAAVPPTGARRSGSETQRLTPAVDRSQEQKLNILMAAGVPKRREGGVATIVYNLGREMEQRGHRVTYVFLDDLVPPDSVSPRFSELIFSRRLAKYIAHIAIEFSLLNLHAPAGLVYGLKRRWLGRRSGPPYVMTLHGLEERRVEVMTREAKKGRAWNFGWKNRAWHSLYHFPTISVGDSYGGWGACVQPRCLEFAATEIWDGAGARGVHSEWRGAEIFWAVAADMRAARRCDCCMREPGSISAGFFIFATRCCGWRSGFPD